VTRKRRQIPGSEVVREGDERDRTAIEDTGHETTERQWTALINRGVDNFKLMRSNGIIIDESPPQRTRGQRSSR